LSNYQWDSGINDWGEDYRFAYGYDAMDNLTLENKYHWESAMDNWFYDSQTVYYWSQFIEKAYRVVFTLSGSTLMIPMLER